MTEVSKYFKFLSDPLSLELLQHAQNGITGLASVPMLSRRQYYGRLAKARKLGLIVKKSDGYFLTTFGEMFIERTKILTDLDSMELYFRSIDRCPTEEERLEMIHQLFNKRPDIQEALTTKP